MPRAYAASATLFPEWDEVVAGNGGTASAAAICPAS